MMSVTNKPFMLSVLMLNVVMQSVVTLNVVAPNYDHKKFVRSFVKDDPFSFSPS